ncbi:Putative DLP12 prophage; antitermination protein Q (fragment) [Xenorhabdus bovienii str. Intermedium]|uniref:Putative DLP12 prophage antitermination protein Q n=2 Tax=Xenorhabdus bovienii TaxID=40576 RepID=A0A077QFA6_XENBV
MLMMLDIPLDMDKDIPLAQHLLCSDF